MEPIELFIVIVAAMILAPIILYVGWFVIMAVLATAFAILAGIVSLFTRGKEE